MNSYIWKKKTKRKMTDGAQNSWTFFALVILLYLFGIFAGVLIMIPAILNSAKINKNAKRKLEVASVSKDENDIQISVLENKIKTLEMALDKALKKD